MFDVAAPYTDAAKVDLLYWQNARLADELDNVAGTLQLERAWMIEAYKAMLTYPAPPMSDAVKAAPEWLRKGQT